MKDWRGTEIRVGSTVVWATGYKKNDMWEGTVLSFVEDIETNTYTYQGEVRSYQVDNSTIVILNPNGNKSHPRPTRVTVVWPMFVEDM